MGEARCNGTSTALVIAQVFNRSLYDQWGDHEPSGRTTKPRENGTAYPSLFTDLLHGNPPRREDDTRWCLCIKVDREPHPLDSILISIHLIPTLTTACCLLCESPRKPHIAAGENPQWGPSVAVVVSVSLGREREVRLWLRVTRASKILVYNSTRRQ